MENKQTAVEWYEKEKTALLIKLENQKITLGEFAVYNFDLFNQAKAMEEEQNKVTENTSDGYHTFKELYEFRKVYNAALFNEWAKQTHPNPYAYVTNSFPNGIPKYHVHKSWKHNDGELCFGGGWFIVVAVLPAGQISNHYEAKDWDLFQIPETPRALYRFDGHTPKDVLERLKQL
jgi:hypothetical protein